MFALFPHLTKIDMHGEEKKKKTKKEGERSLRVDEGRINGKKDK